MPYSTKSKTTWPELQLAIDANATFLISSHVNPDGDCICSELSLYWYIRSLGKEAVIFNNDPLPTKFGFIRNSDQITQVKPDHTFDVFITLDSSSPGRLGWQNYQAMAPFVINIDHHRDNSYDGTLNIIDLNAAATCQILYNFFKAMEVKLPPFIAETLYSGILTDTGGFQFSNTTSDVLMICADLITCGANPSAIYRKIYAAYTPNGLLLRARVWSTLRFYADNRISVIEMPLNLIDECNANYGEIEGMADLALTAQGVAIGMFIKYSESAAHFSLRSNGLVDVGSIAQKVAGGGGHTCAAGCTINLPVAEARLRMLSLLEEELKRIEQNQNQN